jgi:hypothetical protein
MTDKNSTSPSVPQISVILDLYTLEIFFSFLVIMIFDPKGRLYQIMAARWPKRIKTAPLFDHVT